MNLDELNNLFASAWTSEDKALMFEGLVRGSNGSEAPDGAPQKMRDANALGLKWRKEAEDFLAQSSAFGKRSAELRRAKHGTAQPPSENHRSPFDETPNQATSYKLQAVKEQQQDPFATLTPAAPADEQQPERAAEEPTALNLSGPALTSDLPQHPPIPAGSTPHSPLPPSPRRKARFVPPTEQEWLDYCRTTFPLWKETAAKSVHAYYESVQWKGKVDWKACAKTCFYRAKPWDLLPAPVAGNGGCYSSTLPRI